MKLLITLFAFNLSLFAQAPGSNKSEILLQTDPPPAVQANSITTQVSGIAGSQTYYYWVVANYPIGSSFPGGPVLAKNAPDSLNGSNFVTITWQGLTGVISYDVLRTNTSIFPNGICACAIATGVTTTFIVNNTNTITNYTINTASAANGFIKLDNENFSVPTYVFNPSIINGFVPYVGATHDLDLDGFSIIAANLQHMFRTVQLSTPTTDCICAHGGDSTIVVRSAVQLAYVPLGAPGGSGYTNGDTWTGSGGACTTQPTGTLTTSTGAVSTLTVTTPGVCTVFPTGITATLGGAGAVVLFSSCNNLADALVGNVTLFASTYPIANGTLVNGDRYSLTGTFAAWTGSVAETIPRVYSRYGAVILASNGSTITPSNSLVDNGFEGQFHITYPITGLSGRSKSGLAYLSIPGTSSTILYNGVPQPVVVNTTVAQSLGIAMYYGNHGIKSAICNDAGNQCGLTGLGVNAAGTTVNLQTFNGVACAGVLGTVYLTGIGTIANGSPIYITNTGRSCTGTATVAAYVAGGTAVGVSGNAAITSVLGGAQGNMINLDVASFVKEN